MLCGPSISTQIYIFWITSSVYPLIRMLTDLCNTRTVFNTISKLCDFISLLFIDNQVDDVVFLLTLLTFIDLYFRHYLCGL